jgi:curved DNA-binding protein CbpA
MPRDRSAAPAADDFVAAWLAVLDELTYYELFGIEPGASPDDVRASFHRFSDTFHPDRHVGRTEEERQGLGAIFKRGTEAYMVLSDEGLRGRYDAQPAAAGGTERPKRLSANLSRPPPPHSLGPPKLEDTVKSTAARPFARRAEELMHAGDFRQAKLQLVMANHMDPGNEALEAALRDVEAKLKA